MKPRSKKKLDSQQTSTPEGFVSLGAVAEKYGYTQDHAGWLARTGKVDARQVGNRRQWYVREASLRKYKSEIETSIAHGYIPLRMAARQYGYAKDYIGALARSGKIDAQQDAKGRWYIRETGLKSYKDESSQRRVVVPAPIATVASYTVPPSPTPPIPVYAADASEITVVRVNRRRAIAYIAVLLLLITGFYFRHGVSRFALDIMRGFGSEGRVAVVTPSLSPSVSAAPSIEPTPSSTAIAASPSPEPTIPGVQTIVQRFYITNPPTQSQLFNAVSDYFRNGLSPQIAAQLQGPKGDTGATGLPGIQGPAGFSIGSVPNTNGLGGGTIGGITYFGAKEITTQDLTVTGNTTLASLVAGDTTVTTLSGAGLSSCSGKLLWSNGTFTCGVDQTGGGGGGSAIGLREGFTGGFSDHTSVSFDAGGFNLDFSNDDARVSLDYINGPASRAMANTWTALNTFLSGASVSGVLDVDGTLKVAGLIQANGGEGVSYNRIGTNATSQGLGTSNDLLITGSLEVDGSMYSDGEFIANTGLFNNIEGGGLTACNGAGDKLQYDFTSKLFTCGVDQTGGTGTGGIGSIAVREGSGTFSHVTSVSFDAGAFNISTLASESVVKLDYTNGPASRAMSNTWTALNIFSAGASVSTNLEVSGYASTSKFFGSGLANCSGKLLWSNGIFTCGVDATGGTGGGSGLAIKEGAGGFFTSVGSAQFSSNGFNVTFNGNYASISLDYANGPASRSAAQTISGAWTFTAASNQFSNTLEIKTASVSALSIAGTVFNPASYLLLSGGTLTGNLFGTNASFSANLEISGSASASKTFGSGLSLCSGTSFLQYNITTGLFSCTAQANATPFVWKGLSVSGDTGPFTHIGSLTFDAGGFNIATVGSLSTITLDYTNGPASRSIAQTISGAWTFTAASNQFSNLLEANTVSASAYFGNASNMTLARLGNSTYSTVQDLQNVFHSAGWVSGGLIVDNGDNTTVSVTAGTGLIRSSASPTATIYYFDWPASSSITIPMNQPQFIGVDYNGGVPKIVAHTSVDWDYLTNFPIGRVVNDGKLHVFNDVQGVGDHAAKMIRREYETMPLARDERNGGIALGATGTRNVTVSGGALWDRLNRYTISPFNSSGADRFDEYYFNGSSWVASRSNQQWPNTQYNDITAGLVTLGAGNYANLWFYIETDSEVVMVWGQAQYGSLASASLESPPSTIPPRLEDTGRLIGRYIFQASAATPAEVQSVFTTTFQPAIISDHAQLSNLDFASSGHTGFAGTGVSNTFSMLQIFAGGASVSTNFEVSGTASSSKLFGSGLSACTGKLLWSAGLFSCGIDQTNTGTLSAIAVREGSGTFSHVTSISFDAGAFNISTLASESIVKLDYTNGPASRAMSNTWTALNTFSAGASVSTNLEVAGTASVSALKIGGTAFLPSNYLPLSGGTLSGNLFGTNASFSSNVEISGFASASSTFGSGLTTCSDSATSKLLWNSATGKFSCGTDQTGITGGIPYTGLLMGEGAATPTHITTLTFDAGAFNLSPIASTATLRLDYTNGPASRAMSNTWTALNVFSAGASVSGGLEVAGTASVSQLYVAGALYTPTTAGGWTNLGGTVYLTTNSDSVGIGTQNVDSKFELVGQASISGDIYANQFFDRQGSAYFLDPAGAGTSLIVASNVGIGNTSANSRLQVVGTNDTNSIISINRGTITAALGISYTASAGYTGTSTNSRFDIRSNGAPRITILGTGFVGVGTTVPSTLFEVQGTASASYLLAGSSLQVAGNSSASYSRFGTGTTTHSLTTGRDVLITGLLEADSNAFFDAGVSVSGGFEALGYASASAYYGAGLSLCNGTNAKLLWANGVFSCGSDNVGTGSGALIGIREGYTNAFTNFSSISFNDSHFTLDLLNADARVSLDWGVGGPASRALTNTWSALNTFSAGASVSSGGFEVSGTASVSALRIGSTTGLLKRTSGLVANAVGSDFTGVAADEAVPYLVLTNTASLSFERALAGTANQILLTDGGVNSTLTLSLSPNLLLTNASASIAEFTTSASASKYFGGGLVDCNASQFLQYAGSTGRFGCSTPAGGTGGTLQIYEQGGVKNTAASLSFASAHFDVTYNNPESLVKLDWGAGGPASLSLDENVTGHWVFANNASVTGDLELTGRLMAANASISSVVEASTLKATTLTNSTGTLTINAFTLGGAVTGNSQNVTGLNNLTYAFGSASGTFEASTLKATTIGGDGVLTLSPTTRLAITPNASLSANLEVSGAASASSTFGSGLSSCSDGATSKLLWNSTTGKFSCGADQTGGASSPFTGLLMSEGATAPTHITTLTFDAGAFNLSPIASTATLRLDYTNGPASRAMQNTWTALNIFSAGASVSTNFEVSGSASASSFFGAGLTNCNIDGTDKLLWSVSSGRFSCGVDQGGTSVGAGIKVLDRNFTETVISNTAAETTVYSYAIAPNTLSANGTLRLQLGGSVIKNVTAGTFTVRVKLGSTTVASAVVTSGNNMGVSRNGGFTVVLANTGTSTAQKAYIAGSFTQTGNNSGFEMIVNGYGTSSVDMTQAQTLSVTVQPSSADANLSWTGEMATLELGDNNGSATFAGSGAAGQVTFWNSLATISGDNNFYWNNSAKSLGIRTNAPSAALEVQGTASASYVLSSGALQVAGFTSTSYSRFGTATTTHGLAAASDLLISGMLEADGQTYLDGSASVSGNFEVSGTASVSQLFIAGVPFNPVMGVRPASNSLDWDELANAMTLDADTTISNNGFALTFQNASVSGDLKIAGNTKLANSVFISGLANCSNNTTDKLLWNSSNGQFSCGGDQTTGGGGPGGATMNIREFGAVGAADLKGIATISFGAAYFNVTSSGSSDATVKLDWTNGPASRAADSTITGTWEFRNATSVSNNVFMSSTNVGIGTNAPTQKLDVVGRQKLRAVGSSGGIWYTNSAGAEDLFAGAEDTSAAPDFGVWTGSSYVFTVQNSSGNVGIGTTNPTQALHVVGGALITGAATINSTANMGLLQVVTGATGVSYNRIGTNITTKGLGTANDLLIQGSLEVNGSMYSTGEFIANTATFNTIAGAGLSDCDAASAKLLYDLNTKTFSCATDQGTSINAYQDENLLQSAFTKLNFLGAHFAVVASGTTQVNVALNWGAGGPASLSMNETVSGFWTFANSASITGNLETVGYASSSQLFGSGLTSCSDGTNSKLLWNSATGKFSCGTDQTGAASSPFTGLLVAEGTTAPSHITTLTFDAGAFDLSPVASSATLRLDYINGPASRAMSNTWTALNVFTAGASVSTNLEVSGSASASSYFGANLVTCNGANDKLAYDASTGRFSCGTDNQTAGRPASNSLDFDEFVNAMNLDANTTIASHGFSLTFQTASVSGNFYINKIFGSALPNCNQETQTLLYDANFGTFLCGSDDQGASGAGGWTDDGTTVRLTSVTDNVGIGTAAPNSKLHIVGNAGANDLLYVASANANVVGLMVNRKGAVAIGMTGNPTLAATDAFNQINDNPNSNNPINNTVIKDSNDLFIRGGLEVNDKAFFTDTASVTNDFEVGDGLVNKHLYVNAYNTNGTTLPNIANGTDRDTGIWWDSNGAPNDLYFTTGGNTTFWLDSSKNVGIGTWAGSNPTALPAKLSIFADTAAGTELFHVASSNTNFVPFVVTSKNVVAIGMNGNANTAVQDAFNQINENPNSFNPINTAVIKDSNDLFIHGGLEVTDKAFFVDTASVQNDLELGSSGADNASNVSRLIVHSYNLGGAVLSGYPTITNNADRDTGIWWDGFNAPNDLYFTTGGNTTLWLDSSKNVGIGTWNAVNPATLPAKLTVFGDVGNNVELFRVSSVNVNFIPFAVNSHNVVAIGMTGNPGSFDTEKYNQINENPFSFTPANPAVIKDSNDLFIHGGLEVTDKVFFTNTASVGSDLEVAGVTIEKTTGALPQYTFNGDTDTGLFYAADGTLSIMSNGNQKVRFMPSGNVGIGTITPAAKLEVVGDVIFREVMQAAGTATVSYSRFGTGTTSNGLSVASDLLISGALETNGSAFFDGTASVGNNLEIGSNGQGPTQFLINHQAETASASAPYISWSRPNDNFTPAQIGALWAQSGFGGILIFNTHTNNTSAGGRNVLTERMRINAAGNVGIGTTAPNAKLDVNGDVIFRDVLQVDGTATVSYSRIGTGTTSNGLAASNDLLISGQLETNGKAFFDGTASVTTSFEVGSDLLTVKTGGNVGIATNLPAAKLDVQGDLQINISSSSGAANSFALCHTSNGATANQYVIDCGNAPSADYMEMYPTNTDLEEGEIVVPSSHQYVIDTHNNRVPKLERTTRPYQEGIIGITSIASQAGDFNSIGYNIDPANNPKPLALSGRVQLKVSTENGPIHVGDRITSSDMPGVGMKATTAGMTVGTALEDLPALASGSYQKIMVFVGAQYWAPTMTNAQPIASASWQNATFPDVFAMIVDAFKSLLNITFDNGLIKTVKGMFDTVEVKSGVTTLDQDTGLPYCIQVKSGQLSSVPGECGSQATISPTPTESVAPTASDSMTLTPTPDASTSTTATTSAELTPTPTPTDTTTPTSTITETPTPDPSSVTTTGSPSPSPTP